MPRLLAISVPLKFVWEMLQMPAFEGLPASPLAMLGVCGRAAMGDAFVAVVLFGLAVYLFGDHRWFVPARLSRYAVVVGTGLMLHLLVEWYAVRRLALWSYAAIHPVIPGLRLGLLSVLQPLVLLALTFWLLSRWLAARA